MSTFDDGRISYEFVPPVPGDRFFAAQRISNPEAEPTIVGHLVRSALIAPPLFAVAVAAIGANKAYETFGRIRTTVKNLSESARSLAQEMGDGSETSTSPEEKSSVRKLALLEALDASAWQPMQIDQNTASQQRVLPRRVVPEQPISFQRRK